MLKATFKKSVIAFCIFFMIFLILDYFFREIVRINIRGTYTETLEVHENILGTSVEKRFSMLRGLKALVLTDTSPDGLKDNFMKFAPLLSRDMKGTRNFSVAPMGVQRHVYPLEGNEKVLGHNLLNDNRPNVRADVERAIKTREITLSGPYELRQGGLGLVARLAVYEEGSFWGFVAMVLDMPPVLKDAGLMESHADTKIALRDSVGNVFHGDASIFDEDAVTREVLLPDGYWELGAVPLNGWESVVNIRLLVFRLLGAAFVLIFSYLVYAFTLRQQNLEFLVENRTRELSESNRELEEELDLRGKAEERLRQYEKIVAASEDNLVFLDRNYTYLAVNDSYAKVIGLDKEDIVGKKMPDIVGEEVFKKIAKDSCDLCLSGEAASKEARIRRHNGETRDLVIHHYPYKERDGSVSGIVVNIRDITEKKNAERELKFSEVRLRTLIDSSPIGIALSRDGSYTYLNNACLNIFGYDSYEELFGKNLSDLIAPEQRDIIVDRNRQREQGIETPTNYETLGIKKDGTRVPLSVSVTTLDLEEGVSTLAFINDITERKKVAEELKLSEERLGALLELSQKKGAGAGELIDFALEECVRFTRSTGGYLHFFDEKNKSLNLYTWSKEVIKDCTAEKIHNYPLEEAGIWADSLRENKPVIHNDYINEPGKKGYPEGHFPVNRHMSIPIVASGKAIGIVGVGNKKAPYDEDDVKQITLFMDTVWSIIERNRAEERIRKSLKEKEILLKEVHHRVKNNMAVISSLLSLQSGYVDDKVMIDMFTESQGRIRSMALVHEKLYQSDDFTNIDLEDYIVTLSRNVSITFGGDRNLSIVSNIEKISLDIDTLIPCGLIVNELLTNIFKHAFKGQDEQKIELEILRSEDNVFMKIRDNGVGLPEDINPMKSPGLGLKLVTTLTHQLDGTMEVDVNNGTSFNITFPYKSV